MALLPPTSGPRAALSDLRAFLGQRSREQFWGAIFSVTITAIILVVFLYDAKVNTAPPPTVVYVEDFPADRTDEDIKAEQKVDSEERARLKEAKKKQFEEIQRRLGIE